MVRKIQIPVGEKEERTSNFKVEKLPTKIKIPF